MRLPKEDFSGQVSAALTTQRPGGNNRLERERVNSCWHLMTAEFAGNYEHLCRRDGESESHAAKCRRNKGEHASVEFARRLSHFAA
jgi:hypothetical protein